MRSTGLAVWIIRIAAWIVLIVSIIVAIALFAQSSQTASETLGINCANPADQFERQLCEATGATRNSALVGVGIGVLVYGLIIWAFMTGFALMVGYLRVIADNTSPYPREEPHV